ncbi:MAG: macro domain-containing protein [Synergistaceae bacterium]|jgi:O-acetyl-ADP-ribose deacetylase (regulator of RNase III)|nr:macro domain-containing protein [Synergistaceae bacterium]
MSFTIIQQDITKLKVDAIVNAANSELKMGGGVCGAIFKAAGAKNLQAACDKLSPVKTGEAVITPGFSLPANYVIHAVGPVYQEQYKEQNREELFSAYTNSLKRAIENKCESVAFPLISSGIYGYPKDEALKVATSAIKNFIGKHDIDVTLVVFDKSTFVISRELYGAIASYIDEHYIDTHTDDRRVLLDVEREAIYRSDNKDVKYNQLISKKNRPSYIAPEVHIDDFVENLEESFSQMLLKMIDNKKTTDVAVYKRANIDRKLFSKIRSNKNYKPSKRTVISLAIGLELSLNETDRLLKRAGYALSHAAIFDVIIEYFILNKEYDIFAINQVLFEYDQVLLGS